MGKSFQDQLLKAGLVNKQQLNESKSSKHKKKKQKKKLKSVDHAKSALVEQRQLKQTKDRELNQQLQTQRQKKALANEIKQLITANKIGSEEGEIAYKFSDQGKIKQVYVSSQIQNELAAGRLQIVSHENSYVIITAAIAATLLQRDPNYRVIKNDSDEPGDDDYADYKVPDDLIW